MRHGSAYREIVRVVALEIENVFGRPRLRLRARAAVHELRCRECRVTWRSWALRLTGGKRGMTP